MKRYDFLVEEEDFELFYDLIQKQYSDISFYEKNSIVSRGYHDGYKLNDLRDSYDYHDIVVLTFNLHSEDKKLGHDTGWTRCSEYGDRCLNCDIRCNVIDFKQLLRKEKIKNVIKPA